MNIASLFLKTVFSSFSLIVRWTSPHLFLVRLCNIIELCKSLANAKIEFSFSAEEVIYQKAKKTFNILILNISPTKRGAPASQYRVIGTLLFRIVINKKV